MSKRFEVALFDGDGTLFDSMASIYACAEYAMQKVLKKKLHKRALYHYGGHSLPDTLHLCSGIEDLDRDTLNLLINAYIEFHDSHEQIIPTFNGVPDVIRRLKDADVKTGIITTRGSHSLNLILEQNKMFGLFDVFVTGDITEKHKPDPESVLKGLEWLKVEDFSKVVMVGDTEKDVLAGQRAGVSTIGVLYGHMGHKLRTYDANWYVRKFSRIEPIILRGRV